MKWRFPPPPTEHPIQGVGDFRQAIFMKAERQKMWVTLLIAAWRSVL